MSIFISMELYHLHKRQVWELTNARQKMGVGGPNESLTDREIAERLDLTIDEVMEIRCIAENEMISLEDYMEAEKIKEERFRSIRKMPDKTA